MPSRLLLAALPVAFLALFFLYPVASILVLGLLPNGQLDVAAMAATLTQPFVLETLWFTLWQAAVSTLLTVVVALPGAYVFARFEFPGRRLLSALAFVPFVLPTVVVGSAFLALLGPRGPFGLRLDQSIWAILLAHVFYNYAVVMRVVGGVWAQLDRRVEDAAQMLGASRWRVFRYVTLPLLGPAIASAASIVFLFTFTSFGVVLLLGGPRLATLEVEIYRQAAELLNLRVAATLGLLQLATLGGLLLIYGRYQQSRTRRLRLTPARATARPPRGAREGLFVWGNVALIAALLGVPLAMLVERSFATTGGYGLANYTSLFETAARGSLFVAPIEAIRNSLLFAAAATAVCLPLGLLAAAAIAARRDTVGNLLDALITLPLGTSAVIVGFGFLVSLGALPIDLRVSPLLIPIAHSIVALPFIVRATVPVLRSVDRRMRDAAATLGASPVRTWRHIDLPLVGRAALIGGGFAFAVSLGEFGATLFVVRPATPTMPVAIFRLLGQPGPQAFGQAMAMATLLMLVTALAVVAFDRLRAPADVAR